MSKLEVWSEPPAMEPGAPEPDLLTEGEVLWLAYRCQNPEFSGWDAPPGDPGLAEYFAVLRFDEVRSHHLGAPGEETRHKHPVYHLFGNYKFYRVGYPTLSNQLRRYVISFHDETFDVTAGNASVVSPRVEVTTANQALKEVRKLEDAP